MQGLYKSIFHEDYFDVNYIKSAIINISRMNVRDELKMLSVLCYTVRDEMRYSFLNVNGEFDTPSEAIFNFEYSAAHKELEDISDDVSIPYSCLQKLFLLLRMSQALTYLLFFRRMTSPL